MISYCKNGENSETHVQQISGTSDLKALIAFPYKEMNTEETVVFAEDQLVDLDMMTTRTYVNDTPEAFSVNVNVYNNYGFATVHVESSISNIFDALPLPGVQIEVWSKMEMLFSTIMYRTDHARLDDKHSFELFDEASTVKIKFCNHKTEKNLGCIEFGLDELKKNEDAKLTGLCKVPFH